MWEAEPWRRGIKWGSSRPGSRASAIRAKIRMMLQGIHPPERPLLTAEWRHLAVLQYVVDPAVLLPLVPLGTELDSWEGRTLVSMVGFRFLRVRVLGASILFHTDFDEVNLR